VISRYPTSIRPSACACGLLLSEEPHELAQWRPWQPIVIDDGVVNASAVALTADVPTVAEVSQDQRHTAFAEVEAVGHIAPSQSGLVCDRKQEARVVGK